MGTLQGSESAPTAVVGATDSVTRSEATAAFARVGWKAEAFAGSDELREACERLRPTLVLLAFHDMASNEFSLCRELSPRFPVVVATWQQGEGAVDHAYAAGALDVVGVPVRWPLLVSRLARLQASAEAHKALERSHVTLQTTQRIARIGSWVLDLEADRMEWSEQMCELLGLPPGPRRASRASACASTPRTGMPRCEPCARRPRGG